MGDKLGAGRRVRYTGAYRKGREVRGASLGRSELIECRHLVVVHYDNGDQAFVNQRDLLPDEFQQGDRVELRGGREGVIMDDLITETDSELVALDEGGFVRRKKWNLWALPKPVQRAIPDPDICVIRP